MSRIKSIKLDRTSINEDEVLAFNEVPVESYSPGYANAEEGDYFGRSRQQVDTEEEQVDDEEDPFALRE